MKLTLPALACSLALPFTLALTVPPTVNITTNVTTTPPPPTVNITTNGTTTLPPPTVNITTNGTITPPNRYHLQTRVKGDGNADKDGLYVSGYHIGAGENDVTLESISDAAVGYLNGTYQQFDLGTSFPWGMVMEINYDYYAEWELASINAGYGNPGFFFNETGLQYNPDDSEFHGWLACDWWHGVPQLFWEFLYDGEPLPSSCAEVDLLPVAV